MAKTQEELKQLKEEYETLTTKLKELTEEELKQVTGGVDNNPDKPNVIIDNGTGYHHGGFSDEQGPRTDFPSIVGRPRSASAIIGSQEKEYVFDNE